jgi:hypothetical protein
MNTNRTTARLLSLALAAMMTLSMLAGIDSLAANQSAASDLIARLTTLARTPA